MILLSNIPEELAENCLPFKSDYRVLEFNLQEILEQQQLPVELIETLDGHCFLFTSHNGEKNYPRFTESTLFEISKYLEEFGYGYVDELQVYHLTGNKVVPLDRFYNQNGDSLKFIDFLKKVKIYED